MRLVYFGTASFAVPTLERLRDHIILVVSQPDRPQGRGMRLQPGPVKAAAVQLGLQVETPESCRNPEFISHIASMQADALLVAAYGQIMPLKLLESGAHGGINLHGSLLPLYRGAAPIQRAIFDGQFETGVTLMQMDKGMDTGDEIAKMVLPIGSDETYGELQDRLAVLAADLASTWMPRICTGDYARIPQDHERSTHAPKLLKPEGILKWQGDASAEYNRFRAFTPSPGATLATVHGNLKLARVRLGDRTASSGTVISVNPDLEVALGTGSLKLLEIQPEGKKRMSGRDWANGARIKVGESLLTHDINAGQ